MRYAQITGNVVVNIIKLDDAALEPVFAAGCDTLMRIDLTHPHVCIGWTLTEEGFLPPEEV